VHTTLVELAPPYSPAPMADPVRSRAAEAVATAARVAGALGRPDLDAELTSVRERLLDPAFTVLVIGEFKQGKSSLVNALLGAAVCPVDDDVATAVPTVIRWGESWSAAVFTAPVGTEQVAADVRTEVPVALVGSYVTEAANPDNVKRVRSVEVAVPAPLLQNGLVLVDTPGVGGLGSVHAAITIATLPMADAVLFVSDSSQEYTKPELEFLDTARRLCPEVVAVLTKRDLYGTWREVLDLDRGHLDDRGLTVPLLAVSSELRRLAVERADGRLNEESGFPALEAWLRDDVAARGEAIVLDGVHSVAQHAVDELEAQYEAERDALTDPVRRQERLAALAAAEARAGAQRSASARWDLTLADGITDLNRDATHDLEARLRRLYDESDRAVDAIDPAETREEYEQWLYRRAAEHLAANDELVRVRAAELMARVESHFVEDGGDSGVRSPVLDVDIGALASAATRAGAVRDREARTDRVGTGIAALRGSYGGLMMVGILGKVVGLALVSPVSLVLGGLLTARTVKDLRKQSLQQRRHTTKVDGQRYIQELALVARKEEGDRLERIRRQLRDRYHQRARQHQEAMAAALATARADAERSDQDRARRVADVEAELRRLTKLRSVLAEAFAGRRP
jgi:hypothetical protein